MVLTIAACGRNSGSLQVYRRRGAKARRYVQDRIATSGRVVRLGGRNAYVVRDPAGKAIRLSPARLAAPRAGAEVTVSGVFVLDLGTRSLIEATSIRRAGG